MNTELIALTIKNMLETSHILIDRVKALEAKVKEYEDRIHYLELITEVLPD